MAGLLARQPHSLIHSLTLPTALLRSPHNLILHGFGELLHWHPHFHVLLTCGAFTPQGAFLERPQLDLERLQTA